MKSDLYYPLSIFTMFQVLINMSMMSMKKRQIYMPMTKDPVIMPITV